MEAKEEKASSYRYNMCKVNVGKLTFFFIKLILVLKRVIGFKKCIYLHSGIISSWKNMSNEMRHGTACDRTHLCYIVKHSKIILLVIWISLNHIKKFHWSKGLFSLMLHISFIPSVLLCSLPPASHPLQPDERALGPGQHDRCPGFVPSYPDDSAFHFLFLLIPCWLWTVSL